MELDEKTFIRDYSAKPGQAFRQLMDCYKDRMYLFCLRSTPDKAEAEDLTQEVFIRIWKGLSRFRGESKLSTWMYRIAWNVCASHLEKKGRAPDMTPYLEQDEDESEPRLVIPDEDNRADRFEKRQLIEVLFQKLPESHRMVLTLHYFKEQSYEEIASVTGWPLGTVKATLHRAKAQMRAAALQELGSVTVV
jgi:RNA polymerase sigma-70 factor (ECF subfamily)